MTGELDDSLQRLTQLIRRLAAPWPLPERVVMHPRYPLLRDAALVFAVFLNGALAAALLVEPWYQPAPAISRVKVGRLSLPTGDPRPAELIDLVRARMMQVPVTLRGDGEEHTTTWSALGARADLASVGRLLVEFGREDSPAARYYRDEGDSSGEPEIPLPVEIDAEAGVEALLVLKELIDRRPESARFDFAEGGVASETEGKSLDIYGTLDRFDAALAAGVNEVEMDVVRVPAPVTAAELSSIDADTVIGHFSTPYSRMRKDRDRTHNVKLGASRLDGHVIMPDEVFSFNDELGDRSEASGFRYAPVIAGGVVVEGMGGGTCQVASTLYAASFFAGLVVEERQPHSRPSSYIKLGLDATVSYPNLDLKLRNPFDFPVVLHFTAEGGELRAEIRAGDRPYTVTLLRKVIGKRPFPVRTIEDSKLPRGTEVITQLGVPGYTVRRYQIIESHKTSLRFQTVDRYPPTIQFVHEGTGEQGTIHPDAPKADPHKPYRASSYLRMVQGAGDLWYEQSHE